MTSVSFSNLFCWNWLDHAGSTSRSVFQSKPSSGVRSGRSRNSRWSLHGPWGVKLWMSLGGSPFFHLDPHQIETRWIWPMLRLKRVHRRWNSTTQINRKTMSWTSHNPWNKDPVIYNTRTTWKVDGQATKPSLMTSFMSQNSNQWSWHSSHEMLGQKTWTTSFLTNKKVCHVTIYHNYFHNHLHVSFLYKLYKQIFATFSNNHYHRMFTSVSITMLLHQPLPKKPNLLNTTVSTSQHHPRHPRDPTCRDNKPKLKPLKVTLLVTAKDKASDFP